MSSIIDGLAQFFSPTHLLATAALGLLAGQHAKQMRGLALAALAFGLVIGSFTIAFAIGETPAALALLAIAAIAGMLVVVALPLAPLISYPLAFVTGTALALDSPPQAISIPSAIAAQLGTGVAALAALGLFIAIRMKAERPWQRIGVRIIAAWIAASAILVLALHLARQGFAPWNPKRDLSLVECAETAMVRPAAQPFPRNSKYLTPTDLA